jgi:hypothetical protein
MLRLLQLLSRLSLVQLCFSCFHAKAFQNAGTAEPSFTSSLLEEISVKGGVTSGQEEVIRNAGSTLFAGGADTARVS